MTTKVSIIIPAHNAADTLAAAVESLFIQTTSAWEAIIIDDGSTDSTTAIAANFVLQDQRIRTVSQAQAGVSAARNHGIRLAQFDWLLFLDADDWIAPHFLERMTKEIDADSTLDGVYCSWSRVTPNGGHLNEACRYTSHELFAALSHTCAFAIHACVVERSLVEAVGNFDSSYQTCEDWDLWQRIARTGARFRRVEDVLAYYRMRSSSASVKGFQLAKDAMRVITQGHAPDPRVSTPAPAYATGEPIAQLAAAKLYWVAWAAGLVLGSDADARPLMDLLDHDVDPGLNPDQIARSIFYAAILPTCQPITAWSHLWQKLETKIQAFLQLLETQSTSQSLARRTQLRLEQLILTGWRSALPAIVGTTYAVRLEATEPISDIYLPANVERLYCIVELENEYLGELELPVCDGWVSRLVLTDAIAAEFAWKILGRFFEHTIYCNDLESRIEGLTTEDNSQSTKSRSEIEVLHNQIGWTIFLQELWERPGWSTDRFYSSQACEQATNPQHLDDGWLVVEVSAAIPDVAVALPELDVALTVGGVAIGVITLSVEQNPVSAEALRVALTTESGFELCCACVREGLLGRSISDPTPLRIRLAAAAKRMKTGELESGTTLLPSPLLLHLAQKESDSESSKSTLVVGRHSGAMGTSASRWMMFPVEAARELLATTALAREQVFQLPPFPQPPTRGLYAPALIQRPCPYIKTSKSLKVEGAQALFYDRNHFEATFASEPDPWKYSSAYEQTKYEQTLSLLPSKRFGQALELACAEGHFTKQLAPRVDSLIAADISQIALQRTAERCQEFSNLSFLQLDLTKDALPEDQDLIVCSEVLYYVGGKEELPAIAQKLANALKSDGYLIMAHANLVVDEPDCPGFDWDMPFGAKAISDAFVSNASLCLVKEIWTPLYRIQLFQRPSLSRFPWQRKTTKTIKLTQQAAPPSPEVSAHVLWQGGQPRRSSYEQRVVTERLPILMYHRIAPSGAEAMASYRVTPTAFEEQLKYLRDAGFYSVNWEDWQQAMWAKQPLPGRAIALTFDDGYLDFFEYAYPLLEQYGFSATVFLVAKQIGQFNQWDSAYGETVSLMSWQQIRHLQEKGIEFGSHTLSHPPLTALSPVEVVREGARSRAILERGLGCSVKTFAYPYGDFDPAVQRLIGACGYTVGLSCRPGLSQFNDALLALPRIEVRGSDSLQDFVKKLK